MKVDKLNDGLFRAEHTEPGVRIVSYGNTVDQAEANLNKRMGKVNQRHIEFKCKTELGNFTVDITIDDPLSVCNIWDCDEFMAYGIARKRPGDLFSPKIGAKNAFTSALRKGSLEHTDIFTKSTRAELWQVFINATLGLKGVQKPTLKQLFEDTIFISPNTAARIRANYRKFAKTISLDA